VLSATLTVNQSSLVYQHQPPRATEFRWPNPNAAGNASLTLSLVNGQMVQTSFGGPWSLFRLFDAAKKTPGGSADRLTLNFDIQGYRANFVVAAGSVANPFVNADFARFHCVPRL
jgi:type VI secretion system protein ImpL